MNVYCWLIISSLFYAGGEYYSKKWSNSNSYWHLALLFVSYMIGVGFWLPALKDTKTLAITGMIWLIFATIAMVGLGVFIFGEKINILQWIGIILAVSGCILISYR